MFGLGITEGIIILVIVLLLFGGSKIPQLGSALGKAISNFKDGLKEDDQTKEIDKDQDKT